MKVFIIISYPMIQETLEEMFGLHLKLDLYGHNEESIRFFNFDSKIYS